jgi:hypothetical protein
MDQSGDTDERKHEADGEVEAEDSPWSDDETPLRWLFDRKSRAELVSYAVERAGDTDIPYLNKSELAEQTGVSRSVVHKYIDDLVALDIYETRGGDGTFVKYRPNAESTVVSRLCSVEKEMIERVS